MKKTLTAAALAAGYACTAHAQDSISLYGLIDASVVYTNNQGGHSLWQESSGSVTGSHWGIRGIEDLSSTTRAIFQLENGFSVTNGSPRQGGRLFGYQAFAGLEDSRLGKVTFGRQYDSVVDYVAPLSFTGVHPGGNNLSAHPFDNDNLNNSFRVDNAVKYTSEPLAGLSFGTLYAFSDEAGGFADNRVYSFGGSYSSGPVTIAAGYLEANQPGSANTNGAITLTDRTFIAALQRIYGAGINYQLGATTLGFVWTRTQLGGLTTINGSNSLGIAEDGAGAGFSNYEVNANWRMTPALSLVGEYTYTDGSLSNAGGEHRPKWQEASVLLDYFLSKRTDLYVQASYQHIDSDGSGLEADVTGQGMSSDDHQAVAALGMRHRW